MRGSGGEAIERGPVVGDEAGLEHEILRRVPGDRQLRKGDDVATCGVGRVVGIDQLGDVAVEVAHGRIELGERNANDGHVITLTTQLGDHAENVPTTSTTRSVGTSER